jgi:transcriptional regulator with XRE-family HTH domain
MKPGELLSLCREMKGLTLREVEKHTGISNAAVCQAEKGHHGLTFKNAVKLCDLYGISIDRLAMTVRSQTSNDSGLA